MAIRIEVKCYPDDLVGVRIRTLFCQESMVTKAPGRNPLVETNFNELLEAIAQRAFDEGRMFERKNGNLDA